MRIVFSSVFVGFFAISAVIAEPVITEFMADNKTTCADDDGDFSDWIEIHNPGAEPVSLGNWYLTDKPGNLTQWRFPAVDLAPGEFVVVWASGKNRRTVGGELHTNFSLSKDGEFLALVRPDGSTAQSFGASFPAQGPDESFGLRFDSEVVLEENAAGRYEVATGPGEDWREAGFDDSSWQAGPGGYGFGITVPGITVRQVSKNGSVGGLADALSLLAQPAGSPLVLSTTTKLYPVVNFLGEGAEGRYPMNEVPPGGGGDRYVLEATGFVTIPVAGVYTFGLNSDDGGRIAIDGLEIMRDDSFHGPLDHFGRVTLTAGQHAFQAVAFEGEGGDSMEFFAAAGSYTAFDASVFRLVGDVANGGLAASTTPPGGGGLIGTDLRTAMEGKAGVRLRLPVSGEMPAGATAASLVVRYNDGFAAWLDGVKVAAANAPGEPVWDSVATAERTNEASLQARAFNVTSSLPVLAGGQQVLAVHGLNAAAEDPSFLAACRIVAGKLEEGGNLVAYGEGRATPGWINGAPSALGAVAKVEFGVERGFFTAPFSLTLGTATPGATIRYTTDGSTPGETSGLVYSAPLMISSTTVVRAVAVLEDWRSTAVDTHTYVFPEDVIRQSADGSAPAGWPAQSGTSQVLDYGMDPDIVNHADPRVGGAETVKAALLAIPTVLLTTDLPNLFNIGGSQGIYSNPGNRGFAWERPVSVEWIDPPDGAHPNGASGFQINAGLRIRGGASRSTDNPKHAFRLFFRQDYGASKLNYPLFGEGAAQEFDKIDLRTSQNYSWSFAGDSRNTFLREESSRQAQLDMGHVGSHVRYVHVYVNGQYWGLHDLDERTEAEFSESYLGGKKEEYDVVKAEQDAGYTIGATDGGMEAWRELWDKGKVHRAAPTNANYFRMMGLAEDGVTPTDDPVLLDDVNLIDYLLLSFWMGNLDGSVSHFLGNDKSNNWSASRRRDNNPREGFRFFVHDFEHAMLNVNEDRTGPFASANEANFAYSSPMFLHQDLLGNTEYRMRWADRVQRHLFNGGALTDAEWVERMERLSVFVDASIAAESARWGDAKRATSPHTRLTWISAKDELLSYIPRRGAILLAQLRADNLYPAIDAPVVVPFGGEQPEGTEVFVQGQVGATLYYMADGSDPREVGGGLKPGALVYTSSTTSESLIPWSAAGWKYFASGADLGMAWRNNAFDDSAWPVGTAELGYGDGDEATVIPIVDVDPAASGVQKAATCYFRKNFEATELGDVTALSLTIKYDDAFTVYLNGMRMAGNLPANPAYDYYSGGVIEDTTETISVPASLLREGTNTIAVEIHQANAASSDLSMNLSLAAVRATTATPMYLTGPGERTLRFRAKAGATWSALVEAVYQVGTRQPAAGDLAVSEIFYHPQDPHGEAEFLELMNTGDAALDLSGARFTEGIDFTFEPGSVIAAGQRIVLVRNAAAFGALFGAGRPVAGVFANDTALSNSGERLRLESAMGATLLDFAFGTDFPWPESADGRGRSLVLVNAGDPGNPASWRPSATAGGNPGDTDSFPRGPGEGLLEYALAAVPPAVDPATGLFSVTRRLGADEAALVPEWSVDLREWSSEVVTFIAETPDDAGNSVLTWRLQSPPAGAAFFRLRVVGNP